MRERISTADAIVVIGVPVVDDERRAERRGAHGRVATVERRIRAMTDFGFDPGVGQKVRPELLSTATDHKGLGLTLTPCIVALPSITQRIARP